MSKFSGRSWFKGIFKDREVPDPKPMAIPVGFKRPETLAEQVARLVRTEDFRRSLGKEHHESFEEADDFDVDDDIDPFSPFERHFDPVIGREVSYDEFQKHKDFFQREYMEALAEDPKINKLAEKIAARVAKKKPPEQLPSSPGTPLPEGA